MQLFFKYIFLLFVSGSLLSQNSEDSRWSISAKKINENDFILSFTYQPLKGAYFYGVKDSLNPITITFDNPSNFKVIKSLDEFPKAEAVYEEIFELNRYEHKSKTTFFLTIKQKSKDNNIVKGFIDYNYCTDVGCVPNSKKFAIDLLQSQTTEPVDTASVAIDSNTTPKDTAKKEVVASADNKGTVSDNSESEDFKKYTLWYIFWIAFGSGLIAIFTPCVLPMIPMTVTFFMKSSENKAKGRRQAIFYGISIVVIFTVIGSALSIIFGPRMFQWLSTHWIPNLFFFLIFMVFAAAFFGMFEIRMPSGLINKSDAQADKGGFLGPFFMAFTLVLVSFSCTVPIIGMVVVMLSNGEYMQPIVAMFGFGLAFALPFTLFALFPRWLNSLPKSGGWMNSIKVVLGFIEVALGLKFLSVADMTYHWGLLDREIYLALWITIFTLMGFYLLGKIRFPHDSDMPVVKFPRLLMVIVTFAFVVYLIPGMFGAPLKALSGWIPPMGTHDFNLPGIIMENAGSGGSAAPDLYELCEEPKYKDIIHSPHGIKGYYDYEQGLKCAKSQNKPVLIDFSGHGCVSCRKMEESVWVDPEVLKRLKNDYIVIQLYTDDRTELPEEEWTPGDESNDGRVKQTIGEKWGDYQVRRFGRNSQPQYILLGPDGEMLIKETRGYNPDVESYIEFLDKGLEAFKEKYKK